MRSKKQEGQQAIALAMMETHSPKEIMESTGISNSTYYELKKRVKNGTETAVLHQKAERIKEGLQNKMLCTADSLLSLTNDRDKQEKASLRDSAISFGIVMDKLHQLKHGSNSGQQVNIVISNLKQLKSNDINKKEVVIEPEEADYSS